LSIHFAAATVLVTLACSKVLSAQFLTAALVVVALIIDTSHSKGWLTFWLSMTLLTTQAIFPFLFPSLLRGGTTAVCIAMLHAASVVGLTVHLLRGLPTAPIDGEVPASKKVHLQPARA
jgi:hypothetical protein